MGRDPPPVLPGRLAAEEAPAEEAAEVWVRWAVLRLALLLMVLPLLLPRFLFFINHKHPSPHHASQRPGFCCLRGWPPAGSQKALTKASPVAGNGWSDVPGRRLAKSHLVGWK